MPNKIRITVGGIQYSIMSDNTEEELAELARELELRMNDFAKKNPFLSTTMTAVLAALEGYDSVKKLKAENERLNREIDRLVSKLAMLKNNANWEQVQSPPELVDDENEPS